MPGSQYLYAHDDKTYFIKLIGGLSYISCAGFKSFTDKLLSEDLAEEIYFDLTKTTSIDSTNLGILAKCALYFVNKKKTKPIIYSTNKDVTLVLSKNSFNTIFDIVTNDEIPPKEMSEVLAARFEDKNNLNKTILETHEALSRINESNKLKYKDVLQLLRFKRN
jgi:anti-anti-sigma regulatory factor